VSVLSRSAAVVAACLGLFASSAGAATTVPSQDAFYAAPASLASAKPGAVLRTRTVDITVAGLPLPVAATQVLYRTQNQLGEPTATVATVVKPAVQVGPVKLLSYQTAYDGLTDTCRPSYVLRAGAGNSTVVAESAVAYTYVAQGYTVVTSDYEGPTDDFGAGRGSGYGTLDAIRAAQQVLGVARSTPVALSGYSGGSIASVWAAELQQSYAPELDVIGTAAGGVPPDFVHNLDYIAGSSDWAGAIPAVGLGLFRAYRLDPATYLNARGLQIFDAVGKGCLDADGYPGLTFEDLLLPKYQDWKKVPELVSAFNDSIMARAGTPKAPVLLAVGNKDGTGDAVMVAKDVQQLAYTYCTRKVPTQFFEFAGADHVAAFVAFSPLAETFVLQRFAGLTTDGCASISPGNPLDPLPVPSGGGTPGTSGGGTSGTGTDSGTGTGGGTPSTGTKPAARPPLRVTVNGLKRSGGRYSVRVGGGASRLSAVKVTVYAVGTHGKRTRKASVRVAGTVGTAGKRVRLPLRTKKGQRYAVVVSAKAGTAAVTGTLTFRAR
jgi:hypothetical protein